MRIYITTVILSDELLHSLSVVDFEKGGIFTAVQSIDGMPVIAVPSARLKTAYVFHDGRSAGSEQGGFSPDQDAAEINWIVCPRSAPVALAKTDAVKIFTPDQNQDMDSWKTQYRKYHDVWVFDNARDAIRISLKDEPA